MSKVGILIVSAVAAVVFLGGLIFWGGRRPEAEGVPAEKRLSPKAEIQRQINASVKQAHPPKAGASDVDSSRKAGNGRAILTNVEKKERLSNVRFNAAMSSDDKIELLQMLQEEDVDQFINAAYKALDDVDPEVRAAAVSALSEHASNLEEGEGAAELLPLVQKAAGDVDPDIRKDAVAIAAYLQPEGANDVLGKAMTNEDAGVREAVFDALEELPQECADLVARDAFKSNYDDVKEAAVSLVQSKPSQQSFESLLEGLREPSDEFRDSVKETIELFVSEQFDTYEDAASWWAVNKGRYDDEMNELDDAAPAETP